MNSECVEPEREAAFESIERQANVILNDVKAIQDELSVTLDRLIGTRGSAIRCNVQKESSKSEDCWINRMDGIFRHIMEVLDTLRVEVHELKVNTPVSGQ